MQNLLHFQRGFYTCILEFSRKLLHLLFILCNIIFSFDVLYRKIIVGSIHPSNPLRLIVYFELFGHTLSF